MKVTLEISTVVNKFIKSSSKWAQFLIIAVLLTQITHIYTSHFYNKWISELHLLLLEYLHSLREKGISFGVWGTLKEFSFISHIA